MKQTDITNLMEGLKKLANFWQSTGINPLDNYAWRELMQIYELKALLPSIKKVPGRDGKDAEALAEGYQNIEFKSNQFKAETPKKKIKRKLKWPSIVLDMSKADGEKNPYKWQGFGHSVFNTNGDLIPLASFFITKDHIEKLHPLWDETIENYTKAKQKRKASGKKVGDQRAYIKLSQFLEYVDEKDIIWFKDGVKVDSVLL